MTTHNLMDTYGRQPISLIKGSGAYVWDDSGKKYLDALSGIAVCSLGHAHPAITKAICEQAATLIHTSNIYRIPAQEELAEKLCALANMDCTFFSNSGAEANEAAIKIARLYGHQKNIETPTIIVAEGSFYGRTLATLSATGNRKIQAGFEPLVSGFARVPYNDADAIREVAKNNRNIVAVLVEPIQGEGGINIPDSNYLNEIRNICDEHDWLMILDEIQTGVCRTGKWFAHQHNGIAPDIMTVAKALGNGFPIGACLAKGKAAHVFKPGNHGSTYGGNPLACHVALAALSTHEKEDTNSQAKEMGNYISSQFKAVFEDTAEVVAIRSLGMMIGIELDRPCTELVGIAIENNLLINITADKVIRLLPPLNLQKEEADELVSTLTQIVKAFISR